MKQKQFKSFGGVDLKANVEKGIMEGYASVFGNIDSHGDIITENAFNKTVNDWKNARPENKRIKVLNQHKTDDPIGLPTDLYPDSKGLYTHSKISRTDSGEKVLILARDRVLSEMSVGFFPIIEKYDPNKKANIISEIMLMEYSPVTWGSNSLTQITGVKEMKHMFNEYQYSKGNVLDVVAMELLKSIKALVGKDEPSNDTLEVEKSQSIDEETNVKAIMEEIKKYL